jgi:hypothetical protein
MGDVVYMPGAAPYSGERTPYFLSVLADCHLEGLEKLYRNHQLPLGFSEKLAADQLLFAGADAGMPKLKLPNNLGRLVCSMKGMWLPSGFNWGSPQQLT